MTVILIPG